MPRIPGTRANLLTAVACTTMLAAAARAADAPNPPRIAVDVELVLAADASGSMSRELRLLQRDGFVAALRSPRVAEAILGGALGRIAVTYIEWADEGQQRVVVPWRLVDSAAAVERLAYDLAAAEPQWLGRNTAISSVLLHAAGEIAGNRFDGIRTVIDLSGNGRQSAGPPAAEVTARLAGTGIVVNCLALPPETFEAAGPYQFTVAETNETLARHFDQEVRVGAGSFVTTVADPQDFGPAILRKLVLEIAGLSGDQDRTVW